MSAIGATPFSASAIIEGSKGSVLSGCTSCCSTGAGATKVSTERSGSRCGATASMTGCAAACGTTAGATAIGSVGPRSARSSFSAASESSISKFSMSKPGSFSGSATGWTGWAASTTGVTAGVATAAAAGAATGAACVTSGPAKARCWLAPEGEATGVARLKVGVKG
ncbi:hypothetical protein D9M68_473360 [compost metagenome]